MFDRNQRMNFLQGVQNQNNPIKHQFPITESPPEPVLLTEGIMDTLKAAGGAAKGAGGMAWSGVKTGASAMNVRNKERRANNAAAKVEKTDAGIKRRDDGAAAQYDYRTNRAAATTHSQ